MILNTTNPSKQMATSQVVIGVSTLSPSENRVRLYAFSGVYKHMKYLFEKFNSRSKG